MTERCIRLVLAYDGSDFAGWQRQATARTVQEEIEQALARIHKHPVGLVGAGRTDSGVHAAGQCASFRSDIASIEAWRFVPALNGLLPRDVRVLAASEADRDFHARHDARLRRYRYFVLCERSPDPFRLRYAYGIGRRPRIDTLDAMASLILGERDFSAFAAAGDASMSRCRFVHESSWRWEPGRLVFEVAANAFLWRMVRSLVGSMLHFEDMERRGRGTAVDLMRAALESRDRALAGPTAPAQGLFLWNVEYYESPARSREKNSGRGE